MLVKKILTLSKKLKNQKSFFFRPSNCRFLGNNSLGKFQFSDKKPDENEDGEKGFSKFQRKKSKEREDLKEDLNKNETKNDQKISIEENEKDENLDLADGFKKFKRKKNNNESGNEVHNK